MGDAAEMAGALGSNGTAEAAGLGPSWATLIGEDSVAAGTAIAGAPPLDAVSAAV
jgi:hypothetical protein